MGIALNEAKISLEKGKIPIGAVLTIDDKLVGSRGKYLSSNSPWFDHAENLIIQENAGLIKGAVKDSRKVSIYSTLEPCLMCMGVIVHNRISRLVYGIKDFNAGATEIIPPTEWYSKHWPEIKSGVLQEEAREIFLGWQSEYRDAILGSGCLGEG